MQLLQYVQLSCSFFSTKVDMAQDANYKVEVEPEQPFIYPVPVDLEAINLAQRPFYSIEQFYVPERFKPFIEHIILPDGLI